MTPDGRVLDASGEAKEETSQAPLLDAVLRSEKAKLRRASADERLEIQTALIDGKWDFLRLPNTRMIVKGDMTCLSIAAASIVAKQTRDAMMVEADVLHPGYGWASNKGYGAKVHLEALRTLGPTPLHRRSFAPVAQAMLL